MGDNYKALKDVTVHRDMRPLKNPLTGEEMGFQVGWVRHTPEGSVIAGDHVATYLKEALDDSDNPAHDDVSQLLEKVSDDPGENLQAYLPFEGYDDMDTKDLLNAMRSLPSATVARIKEYEATRDEPRDEVVGFNVGFGEYFGQKAQTDDLDVPDQDENKTVRDITTTEVNEGEIVPGEGVTGTGMPKAPFGSKKKSKGKSAGAAGGGGEGESAESHRRGRRVRSEKPGQKQPPPSV